MAKSKKKEAKKNAKFDEYFEKKKDDDEEMKIEEQSSDKPAKEKKEGSGSKGLGVRVGNMKRGCNTANQIKRKKEKLEKALARAERDASKINVKLNMKNKKSVLKRSY
uniref:Uncharacterized protein n=1 Tax=Polytomella parva TaxID=51329 RepID=A0A7S0ULY4_9CHLO